MYKENKNYVKVKVNKLTVDSFTDCYEVITSSAKDGIDNQKNGCGWRVNPPLDFTREFDAGRKIEFYKGGKLETIIKNESNPSFITRIKNQKPDGTFKNAPKNKIITMDLETHVNDRSDMEVTCLSICDLDAKFKSLAIWDYNKKSSQDKSGFGDNYDDEQPLSSYRSFPINKTPIKEYPLAHEPILDTPESELPEGFPKDLDKTLATLPRISDSPGGVEMSFAQRCS